MVMSRVFFIVWFNVLLMSLNWSRLSSSNVVMGLRFLMRLMVLFWFSVLVFLGLGRVVMLWCVRLLSIDWLVSLVNLLCVVMCVILCFVLCWLLMLIVVLKIFVMWLF